MTLYLDNELVTGNNDGTSWVNAFQDAASLFSVLWDEFSAGSVQSDVYVKANDTPFREKWDIQPIKNRRIFFDATGVGTERGSKKSKVFGSVADHTWIDQGNNIYTTTHADTVLPRSRSMYTTELVAVGDHGVWYYSPSGVISLTKAATASVGLNQWYYDSGTTTMYINVGGSITGDIEICKYNRPMELWTEVVDDGFPSEIHGVQLSHGLAGHSNGGCYAWEFLDSVASYNAKIGFSIVGTQELDADPTERTNVIRCVAHNNGSHGFSNFASGATTISGYDSAGNDLRAFFCISYNNGGDGFYFHVPGFRSISNWPIELINCISYNNNTAIGLSDTGAIKDGFGDDVKTTDLYVRIRNTIFDQNTSQDTITNTESSTFHIDSDYNCWSVVPTWTEGINSIVDDPLFSDTTQFYLSQTSPCIGAGEAQTGPIYAIQTYYTGESVVTWNIGASSYVILPVDQDITWSYLSAAIEPSCLLDMDNVLIVSPAVKLSPTIFEALILKETTQNTEWQIYNGGDINFIWKIFSVDNQYTLGIILDPTLHSKPILYMLTPVEESRSISVVSTQRLIDVV